MTAPVAPASPPSPPPARRRGIGPFSLRQVASVLGVIVLVAVGLTVATAPLGSGDPTLPNPEASAYLLRSPVPGLGIGDLAPELEGPTGDGATFLLTDLDANVVALKDLRGRAVWLNFWASWCPPCQSETPILRSMDEAYRDRGLSLVGIQVQQTLAEGQRYAETYGLQYTIGEDVSAIVFRAYRVFALPTQFFIDPQGRIRAIVNGPLSEERARQLVESILPAGGSSASPAATGTASP
jgi:thiol-disulfide isomerase/thioredoxin